MASSLLIIAETLFKALLKTVRRVAAPTPREFTYVVPDATRILALLRATPLACNFSTFSSVLLTHQGIAGRTFHTCLEARCGDPVILKLTSVPRSFVTLPLPAASDPSLSSNYEALVLEAISAAFGQGANQSHFVLLFATFLCPVSVLVPSISFFPRRTYPTTPPMLVLNWEKQLEVTPNPWSTWAWFTCGRKTIPDEVRRAQISVIFAGTLNKRWVLPPLRDATGFAWHLYWYYNESVSKRSGETLLHVMKEWQRLPVAQDILRFTQCLWKTREWRRALKQLRPRSDQLPELTFQGRPTRAVPYSIRGLVVGFVKGGALEQLVTRAWMNFTEGTWRSVIFQVLYALAQLQTQFPGFRHNDLHTENILTTLRAQEITEGFNHISRTFRAAEGFEQDQAPLAFRTKPTSIKRYVAPASSSSSSYFYLPDEGVICHLWDYDISNMPTSGVTNERAMAFNLTVPDSTYDVVFFLQCLRYGIGRGHSSGYFRTQRLTFPPAVETFFQEIIPQAATDSVVPDRPKTYRYSPREPDPNFVFRALEHPFFRPLRAAPTKNFALTPGGTVTLQAEQSP